MACVFGATGVGYVVPPRPEPRKARRDHDPSRSFPKLPEVPRSPSAMGITQSRSWAKNQQNTPKKDKSSQQRAVPKSSRSCPEPHVTPDRHGVCGGPEVAFEQTTSSDIVHATPALLREFYVITGALPDAPDACYVPQTFGAGQEFNLIRLDRDQIAS